MKLTPKILSLTTQGRSVDRLTNTARANCTHRWLRSGSGSQWNKHRKASFFFDHPFFLFMPSHPGIPLDVKCWRETWLHGKFGGAVLQGQPFIWFNAYLLNSLYRLCCFEWMTRIIPLLTVLMQNWFGTKLLMCIFLVQFQNTTVGTHRISKKQNKERNGG